MLIPSRQCVLLRTQASDCHPQVIRVALVAAIHDSLVCFREAAPQMHVVSGPTGQARSSCVPAETLLSYHEALCLMANEKVMGMDCGPCPSPTRRVHR